VIRPHATLASTCRPPHKAASLPVATQQRRLLAVGKVTIKALRKFRDAAPLRAAPRASSRAGGPCYGVGRLRPCDVVLAAGVGQPEADELVPELLVLAAPDGLVEEVLFGARRLLEAGVEGAGGSPGAGGPSPWHGRRSRPVRGAGGSSHVNPKFTPRQPQVHHGLTPSSRRANPKFTVGHPLTRIVVSRCMQGTSGDIASSCGHPRGRGAYPPGWPD